MFRRNETPKLKIDDRVVPNNDYHKHAYEVGIIKSVNKDGSACNVYWEKSCANTCEIRDDVILVRRPVYDGW